MSEETLKKESVGVKFLKGVLIVLIPLVFILTVTTLILKISGFNVSKEATSLAAKIPIVSNFVGQSAKNSSQNQSIASQTQSATDTDLKNELSQQAQEITQYQKEESTQQQTIADLQSQVANLKASSIKDAQAAQSKKAQAKAAVLAATFQNMDPAKAAAIFEKMKVQDAANDLNLLNDQAKAQIMEQLTPDTAAKITPLLAGNPYSSSSVNSSTTATTTP